MKVYWAIRANHGSLNPKSTLVMADYIHGGNNVFTNVFNTKLRDDNDVNAIDQITVSNNIPASPRVFLFGNDFGNY